MQRQGNNLIDNVVTGYDDMQRKYVMLDFKNLILLKYI